MKVFKIIVSVALCAVILTSCVGTKTYIVDDDKPRSAEAPLEITTVVVTAPEVVRVEMPDPGDPEKGLSLLFDEDCKGGIFLIAFDEDNDCPAVVHEDSIYKSASNRLSLISAKYNLVFADYKMNSAEMFDITKSNVKSDDYTADLMLLPLDKFKSFAEGKLLEDLNNSAFYDNESYYFSRSIAEYLTYKGGVYGVWTDVLKKPTDMIVLYVNLDLYKESNTSDIEKDALEGKLTWDYLGAITDIDAIPNSTGTDYIRRVSSGEDVSDVITGYLARDDGEEEEDEGGNASPSPLEQFLSGEEIFYFGTLEDAEKLGKTAFSWSLLPVPKETTEDFHRRIYDYTKGFTVACIPLNCYYIDRSVQIICALSVSAVRSNELEAAEYLYQYLRSNNARLLLNYILFDSQ